MPKQPTSGRPWLDSMRVSPVAYREMMVGNRERAKLAPLRRRDSAAASSGMSSWDGVQIGSSPSVAEQVAASPSATSSFADAHEHTQRNSMPEDQTVQFIGSLVRTSVNRLPLQPQTGDNDPVIEYRFSRQSWTVQLDNGRILRAVDDGGLNLRLRDPQGAGFLRATSSVALLEAKPGMSDPGWAAGRLGPTSCPNHRRGACLQTFAA